MDIEVSKQKGEFCLTIIGPIDDTGVEQLKMAFEEVYRQSPSRVKLNLKAVSTINSSGIGKILMLYKNLRKDNGSLEIIGISDNLFEIFQLIKLDKIISIQR